jgi:hypothetical protein
VRANFPAAIILMLAAPAPAPAARLTQPAKAAFDAYIAALERRLDVQHSRTGGCVTALSRSAEPGEDEPRVEPVHGGTSQVQGGLMHHWRAAALVPGAGPRDMLALLRNYNHLARYYAPEVVSSRALSEDGAKTAIEMRFRKHQVVTVVLDAEFDTQSGVEGSGCGYSVSRSTHIWQVDRPGTARERRRPEGSDDGYLWRLNSYWSFAPTAAGLLIECEAVSLTRDVPTGLGWLITPIISNLPRESLQFTLAATKNALSTSAGRRHSHDRTN